MSTAAKVPVAGGKALPVDGKVSSPTTHAVPDAKSTATDAGTNAGGPAAAPATPSAKAAPIKPQGTFTPVPAPQANAQVLVTLLNKHLNNSGRPDQYRVDPHSDSTIQEVNPANGEVVAQFPASEFPTLARSIGAAGLLIDSLA